MTRPLQPTRESRFPNHRNAQRLGVSIVLAVGVAMAAAEPYCFGNIRLGTSFDELARLLDFRDIHAALEAQLAAKATQPDLGRRGYGCMRREDPYADIACVSHEEKVGGTPTRVIRLQFLNGVLQQLSITAEISEFEGVLAVLRQHHGAPQETRAATARAACVLLWPALRIRRHAAAARCFARGTRWSRMLESPRPGGVAGIGLKAFREVGVER